MPNEPIRLLLVEDNADDAFTLTRVLLTAGYVLTHERVETELEYRRALTTKEWDVILADYSLPAFSAVRALQILQESELDIPFIVVTGTITDVEAVKLMEMGAPDYIIKERYERLPFVVARETRARLVREKAAHDKTNLQTALTDLQSVLSSLRIANDLLAAAPDELAAAFARALERRDKETEGHAQRVTTITERLARFAGVENGTLRHMRRGALLHDVGKIGIPDAILHKPGPLTDAEWQIMRLHPVYAYEILSPLMYFRDALDIPYYHHERWDGSGYPRGLAGEQIPLAARIFALADVWDALTRDRVYRKAWSEARALKEITAQAGSAFDPAIVATFVRARKLGALS